MAVRETLEFDLRAALLQVNELEGMIDDLRRPVTLDLDIRGDATREIQTIDDRMDDIIVSAQHLSRELGETEGAASRSAGEVSQIATEMGIAEGRASDLARELIEGDRAAGRLDIEVGEVVGALGRSERQAAGLSRELREADRAAASINTTATGLEGKLRGAFAGVAAGTGIALGLRGANAAIQSFAVLEDSVNAVNVVFDTAAGKVFEFGERAAESAGLSESAFNQAVVPIGALLQNFGFDATEAADAAVILVQRAADMASVIGGTVPEALAALSSALRGEADPLEVYGASVSAVAVQQYILRQGLADTVAEITPAITLQGRLGLALQDTAKFAGDYANTAGDLANLQRTAGATAQEFGTDVGEVLAPALEGLVALVPDLLEGLRQMVPGFANAADSAGAFFDSINEGDGIRAPFQAIAAGIGVVSDSFGGLSDLGSGVFDILTLNFDGVGEQMDQFADRFARTTKRISGQNLARELDKGTDASLAFVNAISDFAGKEENIRVFADSYQTFAVQAGLSGEELRVATRFMIDNADQANLSAKEVQFLREQYALLNDTIFPSIEGIRELNRVQREAADAPPIFPPTTTFTTFSTDVDLAAKNAAADLKELADIAAAQASRTASAFDLFADQPEKLTESFNEGVQALREAVLAQRDFDINVAILRALNLDALADDFQRLGVGAAEQLVEAINDIPTAIESDQLLQGFAGLGEEAFNALVDKFIAAGLTPADARKLADSVTGIVSPDVIAAASKAGGRIGAATAEGTITEYREALLEEGQQMDTALIEAAIDARVAESFTADDQAEYAATSTVTAWEAAAITAAENLSGLALQARLGDLFSDINFVISADQFQFPTSFSGVMDLLLHPTATVGGTSTMMQGGGVTIYQTFTGEIRDLDTQLAQANQSTSAVANLFNRVQS